MTEELPAGLSSEYLQWMSNRRYRIIRSSNDPNTGRSETVVATGLTIDEAHKKQSELEAAEDSANPEKSSWTVNLYHIQLETPAWKPKRKGAA